MKQVYIYACGQSKYRSLTHSEAEAPGEEAELLTLPPPDILLPLTRCMSGLQTVEVAGDVGSQGGCQATNAEALAAVPCWVDVDALQAGPYSIGDCAVGDAVPGVSDREDLVAATLEPGEQQPACPTLCAWVGSLFASSVCLQACPSLSQPGLEQANDVQGRIASLSNAWPETCLFWSFLLFLTRITDVPWLS
eukprot:804970-Rhodomonas_salina.1